MPPGLEQATTTTLVLENHVARGVETELAGAGGDMEVAVGDEGMASIVPYHLEMAPEMGRTMRTPRPPGGPLEPREARSWGLAMWTCACCSCWKVLFRVA